MRNWLIELRKSHSPQFAVGSVFVAQYFLYTLHRTGGPDSPFALLVEAKNFFNDVYDVVRQIPEGRVTSYGAIASFLGSKLSARMVGWAMNACHGVSDVPAHRVVNRDGVLSGKHFFGSPTAMQELLEAEGIVVENDKIVGFKKVFWNPGEELL